MARVARMCGELIRLEAVEDDVDVAAADRGPPHPDQRLARSRLGNREPGYIHATRGDQACREHRLLQVRMATDGAAPRRGRPPFGTVWRHSSPGVSARRSGPSGLRRPPG